jgi:hypothetical protein
MVLCGELQRLEEKAEAYYVKQASLMCSLDIMLPTMYLSVAYRQLSKEIS